MQRFNNHEIVVKVKGNRFISVVRKGLRLVWMAVRSCFGSGIWVSEKPWLGNEEWKSNK